MNSAGNWGLFDMFGGGLFSTIMKRSKMNDAQCLMEAAKSDLKPFQKELGDVNCGYRCLRLTDWISYQTNE